MSYTTEILKSAGLDQSEIAQATVGYSCLTVVATGVGVSPLLYDDFLRCDQSSSDFIGQYRATPIFMTNDPAIVVYDLTHA